MDPSAPSFMQNYLAYNVNNECPRNYHLWTALLLLASATQKRVYVPYGYLNIYPNLYVCLVGRQGFRKSTAKDIGRDLLTSAFPDLPLAPSVQSREDIIKFMSSDECLFSYTDENGAVKELRPFVMFVNELKNFLSINPAASIEFLTDIYDRDVFDSSTIKRGLEKITNPCVNILACETPSWITEKLKAQVISGGFSRRMIFVYETTRGPKISFPRLPDNSAILWHWLKEHLQKVPKYVGPFSWQPEARTLFDNWYQNIIYPEDDVMEGYYESKHTQLLKVTMLLSLAEDEPKLILRPDLLTQGIAMLDAIEINMPKLSAAAGRNDLALPMQRAVEVLEANAGLMSAMQFRTLLNKDLRPVEQHSAISYLVDMEKIYPVNMKNNGHLEQFYVTKSRRDEMAALGQIE